MVFRKIRKIIMTPALNEYKGYHTWIYGSEFFTLGNGNKPIPASVNDIGMAFYLSDPPVCTQVITKQESHRQNGQKSADSRYKAEKRSIQDKISGVIITGDLCRESATEASSVNNQAILTILFL